MQQQQKSVDAAVAARYCVDVPPAPNIFAPGSRLGNADTDPDAKLKGALRARPGAAAGTSTNAGASKKVCPARIPDPIFNSVHPATVMVYFENTNGAPSDRMVAKVTDSMGLYTPATVIVPSLDAGQSTSIPVVLREDTQQFLDVNKGPCSTKNVVTVSGTLACEVQKWRDKYFQVAAGTRQPDVFAVSFSVQRGGMEVAGLDAQSSGRPLQSQIVLDPGAAGGSCVVPAKIMYPAGWTIATTSRSVIPDTWDNLFGTGVGSPYTGHLRTK